MWLAKLRSVCLGRSGLRSGLVSRQLQKFVLPGVYFFAVLSFASVIGGWKRNGVWPCRGPVAAALIVFLTSELRMNQLGFTSQCQPKSKCQAVPHQFALKSLLWAVAFICAELAAIRSGGLQATPLCINIAVCAFLLTCTYSRTWTGTLFGLLAGVCVAEALLFFHGFASTTHSSLFVATIATLGSWFGIAIYAIRIDDFIGAVSIIPACSWVVLVIEWGTRLFE